MHSSIHTSIHTFCEEDVIKERRASRDPSPFEPFPTLAPHLIAPGLQHRGRKDDRLRQWRSNKIHHANVGMRIPEVSLLCVHVCYTT